MFRNLILAAFVVVSFGGAILAGATPAAADDDVVFEYGALVIRYGR
ncbi:MAG: hypothetical protein ACLQE9_22375 [Roseiarcus sp.]